MTDNPHGLVLPPELSPRGRSVAPRGRRLTRIMSWVAVITSATVLLASGAGFVFVKYFDGRINRLSGIFGDDKDRPVKSGKSLNFLLVGSDTREGATPEELARYSTTFEAGRRSDTIILIHLSAKQDKATLLSFPRDAWVEIPAYKGRAQHMGKINTAFAQGGPALAVATVERLTQVRIDHYIEVNFAGFLRMVDALGGVDVCLAKAQKEKDSGINLPAGRSRIKGPQALAFVRQRKGLPRGDIDRIARQQQFLGAMLRRATSVGVIANPVRLVRFLQTVTDSVQVDENLSFNDLKDLALELRGLDPARVTFLTAPVDRSARRNGQSVVLLHPVEGPALFRKIAADERITDEPSPGPTKAPVLTVAPSRVRVRVLNGTPTVGWARTAAADLVGVGFRVTETTNADATTYTESIVRYGPDRADSARTLAAAVTGAKTERVAEPGRLELVVGSRYTGTKRVTVTATQRPTGAATARATPKPVTAADDPCA